MIPPFCLDVALETLRKTVPWKWIGVGILIIVAGTLAYCSAKKAGAQGEILKEQGRSLAIQAAASDADTNASEARVYDTVTLSQQKDQLDHATQTGESPDVLRARRGCLILRQQGRNTSSIAACRGFEAGR